jgi:hypothetical protein
MVTNQRMATSGAKVRAPASVVGKSRGVELEPVDEEVRAIAIQP